MKRTISAIIAVILTAVLLFMSSCTKSKAASDPFGFAGNAIEPEAVIDGDGSDELWNSPDRVEVDFGTTHLILVRRPDAIYLYYKVKDITPYSYVSTGDDDEVTKSDSIEFYVDSKLGRADAPVGNCYQINLGRDGRTRILSGSKGVFNKWLALYTFEVREGQTAEEYDYYYVEVMLPVAQMNMGADEAVGVAFGQVDRIVESNVDLQKNFTWTGLSENGAFVDPQVPSTYLVLTPKSLIQGQNNRLYTYSEYLTFTARNQ